MASPTYGDVLASNIRAARSRKNLGQATVVARMRALGFDEWHRQTMGKVERGERRLLAEEVFGLALALETSVGTLMDPKLEDALIALPSGALVPVKTVLRSVRHFNDGMVWWEDEELRIEFGDELRETGPMPLEMEPFEDFTREQMIRRNQRINPPRRTIPNRPRYPGSEGQ